MTRSTGRKPGFNTQKGVQGFVTAPPVIPDVPTIEEDGWENVPLPFDSEEPDPSYDNITAVFQQLVPEEDEDEYAGLTPEEIEAIQQIRAKELPVEEVLSGPGAKRVTVELAKAWGHKENDAVQVREKVQQRMSTEDLPEGYLSPQKAGAELRVMLDSGPFTLREEGSLNGIFSQIETGEILLTEGDMVALRAFQAEMFVKQEQDNSLEIIQPLGGEWVPAVVQRQCTICGKFVGARMEHVGDVECRNKAREKGMHSILGSEDVTRQRTRKFEYFKDIVVLGPASRSYYRSQVRESILQDDELMSGEAKEVYPDVVSKNFPEYSEDEIDDIYASLPDFRDVVILSLGKSSRRFGGKQQYPLPRRVRAVFVENPVEDSYYKRNNTALLTLLAARIEPPLNDYEMKHIIDVAGPEAVEALLKVKRTRRTALDILTSYPTEAGYSMAYVGTLNEATLEAMANSGDPAVRVQAAVGFNTSAETRRYLAEDPDENVRKALIQPPYTDLDDQRYTSKEKLDGFPAHERQWRVAGAEKSRFYMKDRLQKYAPDSYYGYSEVRPRIIYESALQQDIELGSILINDSSVAVAEMTFQAFPVKRYRDAGCFSAEQRFLISKITSRRRFNEIKRYILSRPEEYPSSDPDVARFLAR